MPARKAVVLKMTRFCEGFTPENLRITNRHCSRRDSAFFSQEETCRTSGTLRGSRVCFVYFTAVRRAQNMKIIRPERTLSDYQSIINLPHHEPASRPRMNMLDRAAQFAPYAALVGYGDMVAETARVTDKEKIASDEQKSRMDTLLQIALRNPRIEIQVCYFVPDSKKSGGSYQTKTGRIKKIDPLDHKIIFSDKTEIRIDRIQEIRSDAFEGFDV